MHLLTHRYKTFFFQRHFFVEHIYLDFPYTFTSKWIWNMHGY